MEKKKPINPVPKRWLRVKFEFNPSGTHPIPKGVNGRGSTQQSLMTCAPFVLPLHPLIAAPLPIATRLADPGGGTERLCSAISWGKPIASTEKSRTRVQDLFPWPGMLEDSTVSAGQSEDFDTMFILGKRRGMRLHGRSQSARLRGISRTRAMQNHAQFPLDCDSTRIDPLIHYSLAPASFHSPKVETGVKSSWTSPCRCICPLYP